MNFKKLLLIIVVLFLMVNVYAEKPIYVEVYPDHGDIVDSSKVDRIYVKFNQKMSKKGYSFMYYRYKSIFPETIGKPKWISNTECVLEVDLKKGKKYAFALNRRTNTGNFKNIKGESAKYYPVLFQTKPENKKYRSNKNLNKKVYKRLVKFIKNDYSYYNYNKDINYDKILLNYKDKIINSKTFYQLAINIGQALSKFKDPHVWTYYKKLYIPSFRRDIKVDANFNYIKSNVSDLKNYGRTIYAGNINNKIGYLFIGTWSKNKLDLNKLFNAYNKVKKYDKLIIDVRFNSGGDENKVQKFAGIFTGKKIKYAKQELINGKTYTRELLPNKNFKKYNGDVVVLTGNRIMSSNEAFLLMMKEIPNCTLIGKTSYGSSGNPQRYSLLTEVNIYLPGWKAMNMDGEIIEGKGVKPDIIIKKSEKEYYRSDPTFINAVEYME